MKKKKKPGPKHLRAPTGTRYERESAHAKWKFTRWVSCTTWRPLVASFSGLKGWQAHSCSAAWNVLDCPPSTSRHVRLERAVGPERPPM
eukprot:2017869-Pyramimonas_sp.AAC.1